MYAMQGTLLARERLVHRVGGASLPLSSELIMIHKHFKHIGNECHVMRGSDLLVYLRRHGFEKLPIIIMTAGLSPLVYLAQGATEVLPKPFDVNMVVDKVAQHLPLERGRAAGAE